MLNILGLLETDWDLWAQVSVSQKKDGEKESSGSTADYMLLVLS